MTTDDMENMTTSPLRTRIAPSPTARMHAGNVFSALMAWLIARKSSGEVILRIEDLDRGRSRNEHIDSIMRDLEWLGLTWDGEVIYQSERDERYSHALERLETRGLIYPCFCSRADLHSASAPHETDGETVYPGTCRDLTEDERASKARYRRPARRMLVPNPGEDRGIVRFHDLLQGEVTCDLGRASGDFIVRRSDSIFAYQLAVVVDDLEQGVNTIVRGCDLLASTPQQLYLRAILEGRDRTADEVAADMAFLHLPLFVGADGRRLSKRNHDCDMTVLRERYKTPQAIIGAVAYASGIIGRGSGTDGDEVANASMGRAGVGTGDAGAVSLQELLERFNLDALKLRWIIEWGG